MFAAVVLLTGVTGCSSVEDNPSSGDIKALEQSLVGMWWDEFEYADVTEAGVPFSRAMLAVKANADHTGCLYLGVFDDTSDEPLAIYGGPQDASFTWRLLADGSIVLTDQTSGESMALTRGADASSYGKDMTDVSNTSLAYTDGGMAVTNGDYSGTLTKADDKKETEIDEMLTTLSPDRQAFEAQLSQMLANSQKYIKLDTTMLAAKLLTEFISQLNIKALGPQISGLISNLLTSSNLVFFDSLPEAEEARWALANSNFPNDSTDRFLLFNADIALGHSTIEFTTGKDTAQFVGTGGDALSISCKNATTGAVTKANLKFSGATDGVVIFFYSVSDGAVAVQFPHAIDIELLRSETGSDADMKSVMTGKLVLESTDGKKYISLKRGEWRASLYTKADKPDRYEIPDLTLTHHADHTIEASASLAINGTSLLSVKGNNYADPYSEQEIEQLSELRDIAPIWKGCYTLLKTFNSRTATIELTMAEDLLFNIDMLDTGQFLRAAANALKYQGQQPSKETIDPWTDLINKSMKYTVTQKSTGVKAEGCFITSVIGSTYLPTPALRFSGESSFRTIHERMSPTDRQHYEALLKEFREPFNVLNALLKAVQDIGLQLKGQNNQN